MSDRCIVIPTGKPAFLAATSIKGQVTLIDIALIGHLFWDNGMTFVCLKNGDTAHVADTPASILLRLKTAGYDIVT